MPSKPTLVPNSTTPNLRSATTGETEPSGDRVKYALAAVAGALVLLGAAVGIIKLVTPETSPASQHQEVAEERAKKAMQELGKDMVEVLETPAVPRSDRLRVVAARGAILA